MAARPDVVLYFKGQVDRLTMLIKSELARNEVLNNAIADLNSLGVLVGVECDVKLSMVARDDFIPPQDLSRVSESELDKLFSPEDLEMLGG